jgi:hypothetical protein
MMVRLFFILLPKRQSVMSFVLHPSSFVLHPSSFVLRIDSPSSDSNLPDLLASGFALALCFVLLDSKQTSVNDIFRRHRPGNSAAVGRTGN